MNIYKKHSGIFILIVFLAAQMGEPMHYLLVNHISFKTGAPGNEIKAPVIAHACSQFYLLKNRLFFPPGQLETSVVLENGAKILLPSFYFQNFVKEIQSKHAVRGPPLIIGTHV